MSGKLKRRKFIGQVALGSSFFIWPGADLLSGSIKYKSVPGEEPLLNWSLWEKHRHTVHHPCLTIKEKDIALALDNTHRYDWARNYKKNILQTARSYLPYAEESFLNNLITFTTPGHSRMTPCPSCRDKGFPVHPAGFWEWSIEKPDVIECEVCGVVFPNDEYPETIHLKAKWGRYPQTISYFGGEPFEIFGFKKGRPSFSGNVRSRKVRWAANYSRMLAEAYALSGDSTFAEACKRILLRLATCYPSWMIHVGYGEYADMDPRIAAQHIKNLPEDELTPPPNVPDRQLWTGYWSAGRTIGRGLDATFVRKVVEAYDLTCSAKNKNGKPLYSEDDRIMIERDLLLESTILLVCDKGINNKSISNRTAVGLVGICTGHPEMVRFALEGFDLVMHDWFLPDGTTKESPFYALMTLGGIWDLAQSIRDYSDPPGYEDASGKRIDGLNLYEDPAFQKVWEAFYKGLQGDLTYPPYADSFHDIILDPSYVELMVANYPEKVHYLALLQEYCGEDLSLPTGPVPSSYFDPDVQRVDMMTLIFPYDLARASSPSSFSLYYRKPDKMDHAVIPVRFSDWNPANLRIGHMRTGEYGRESLLLLNASHWRGHNHHDSLDLYYWKNGQTILSDLGYLWDHPDEEMTSRTLAHNTVLINEENQVSRQRGGDMRRFQSSQHVKLMEAESNAYAQAAIYRRTSAIIDHGDGCNYVIDFFRVQGGNVQDYVFHVDTLDYEASDDENWKIQKESLYDFDTISKYDSQRDWQLTWAPGGSMKAKAWLVRQKNEISYIGRGWGQKDWENSDFGAHATYIVRRCKGDRLKTFISVFEGNDTDKFFVQNVSFDSDQNLLIIDTSRGRDYIISALDREKTKISAGSSATSLHCHFGVVSVENEEIKWKFLVDE